MTRWVILFFVFIVLIVGCNFNKKYTTPSEGTIKDIDLALPLVVVQVAGEGDFTIQHFSNGKIYSGNSAEIRYRSSGILENVYVSNNQLVSKGQHVASIENSRQQLALEQAVEELKSAKTELQSLILGYTGGSHSDTSTLPKELIENLNIQSGITRAEIGVKLAQKNLEETYVISPIFGAVAGLNIRPFTMVQIGEKFCEILDNKSYEIQFSVLELELKIIGEANQILVIPFSYPEITLKGEVSDINPIVDEFGLIKIKAKVPNPKTGIQLADGMNVKVIAERIIPDLVTIPIQALVKRNNRNIVFTLEKGMAKWNYVTVAHQNSHSYAISEGINKGDSVIISGNLNLAHDVMVTLENN
jgi:membrane fusion protein, multidrug efflux system